MGTGMPEVSPLEFILIEDCVSIALLYDMTSEHRFQAVA
jgi:hypothetical protein